MKKRLTFKCWSCKRKYELFQEITEQQELIVACPFCGKEARVTLEPYKQPKKTVIRGDDATEQTVGVEYQFPDLIPTEPPTE